MEAAPGVIKRMYLISVLLLFSPGLYSQVQWTKHPANPVLEPGLPGEWDELFILPGSVLYLENTYHMWYWAGDPAAMELNIGHAVSPDGITWTKDTMHNPVLEAGPAGAWDENNLHGYDVLKMDSVFHMWYSGHNGTDPSKESRIGHATSPDGVNWTKDTNNPVLDVGTDGEWDDTWVTGGSVVHVGSDFHIWYCGWNGTTNMVHIGHATSHDGSTWTKDPTNPVLSSDFGSWDWPRVDFPMIIFDGTMYHMWYSGGAYAAWQIGYATSDDGSEWMKHASNPVLKKGSTGNWDGYNASKALVIDSCGVKYKMWYGGSHPDGTFAIGYAESNKTGTRLHEAAFKNDPIKVYPNPINKLLNIETKIHAQYSVEITSNKGQRLYNTILEGTSNQIDLSFFQKGIYFITIRSKDFVATRKIIKM